VTVSLLGVANDGQAGEKDDGLNAEHVIGGNGNDTLVGKASPNTLRGLLGNDRLFGLDGDDTLIGSEGTDFAPPNRVARPISARSTMLAGTSIRNAVIRLRSSLCAVLRVASRLQCSVASNCARTLGGAPSVPCTALPRPLRPTARGRVGWTGRGSGGGSGV
jgi:Ca2+-binding RTX toxin-like protein